MRRRGLIFNSGSSGGSSNWWENYMTIEALANGLTATLVEMPDRLVLEYSLDGKTWTTLADDEYTPAINTGEKIAFRGNGSSYASSNQGIGTFNISHKCNLLGNCMSLLYGDNAIEYDTVPKYGFSYLFYNCDNIISVADNFLPASKVADFAYQGMFDSCDSLIKSPQLPAVTIAQYCYYSMFYNCRNLVEGPSSLPAMSLKLYCYYGMFQNCSLLKEAPALPAVTLVNRCYDSMFKNCSLLNHIAARFITTPSSTYTFNWVSGVSSTGTFYKNADATWNVTGVNGVPEDWTVMEIY